MMHRQPVKRLRKALGLSRAELGRFLGVSDATIVRWESDDPLTEPRGLQALLLAALGDATRARSPEQLARIVRSCGVDHRRAVLELLRAAEPAAS